MSYQRKKSFSLLSQERAEGAEVPLHKGYTHQESPSIIDKGMAPQTQQLKVLIQGVKPATLTAVEVVTTIVYGLFQVGDNICCFQPSTHTKSPGEYGCIVVPGQNGILSWT